MPTSSDSNYLPQSAAPTPVLREDGIEYGFIGKLQSLKYEYRADITNRALLEKNFREKFESLNRVRLTNGEFARLLDEIVSPDVFTAAKTLREINAFTRDDGTPLNYTLVNIRDWCKNTYHVRLFFLALPNADTAIAGVAERVRQGGHDIPAAVIRRRFAAGLRNFEKTYKSGVDAWAKYDNVGERPILLDWGENQ